MLKVLIIRFSSIGDIVLTTPIIRCVKNQLPGAEIHFLTKKVFEKVIVGNPYIDKNWFFESVSESRSELKKLDSTTLSTFKKMLRAD
jgi:ADP-heptose:LPS heptosyltransferase